MFQLFTKQIKMKSLNLKIGFGCLLLIAIASTVCLAAEHQTVVIVGSHYTNYVEHESKTSLAQKMQMELKAHKIVTQVALNEAECFALCQEMGIVYPEPVNDPKPDNTQAQIIRQKILNLGIKYNYRK